MKRKHRYCQEFHESPLSEDVNPKEMGYGPLIAGINPQEVG